MVRVLAVDLGASSLRVAAVDLAAHPIEARILHQYEHAPARRGDGTLRWDWARLVKEAIRGLEIGMTAGAPVASIGIDAWGVDYGLLDGDGALISDPYCYRDARTDGWGATVEVISAERLYRTTGIQLMQINTVFQLAAHDREELGRARRLLMLPELLVYELTGAALGERTSAGTTGLVDLATGDWAPELLSVIGVDPAIMPAISRAPSFGGEWRSANGQRVPVHLVGEHDTASAIAALPSPLPEAAFISSGTWMLVGTERGAADVTDAAMRANFSNEPGVLGGVRLLKNVMGLWMLEQCRTQWGDPPLGDVMARAGQIAAGGPTCDATDPRFLAPLDMEAEVRAAAALPPLASREVVARCILDSLAAAAAKVVRELEDLTGARVPEVCIVGGGSRNTLLNALIEQAAGVPVRTGAAESTLLGNALVQGVGLGMFESLAEARAALRP